MRWILALLIFAAIPAYSYAADGSNCTLSAPSGTTGGNPPIACRIVCDTKTGATDCGPIYIGDIASEFWVIRVTRIVNAGADCTYDDWNVYTINDTNNTATYEQPPIGVLDDDGTVTLAGVAGGQQLVGSAPIGPYLWIDAGTIGACSNFTVQYQAFGKAFGR